jgi:hypothetical protein
VRFDDINLFGNFTIGGLTGPSGRVLGVTNGVIGWIPVSSGGGGVGSQGATGPYICQFNNLRMLTAWTGFPKEVSSNLSVYAEESNFIHSNSWSLSLTNNSVILSSSNAYLYGSNNSVISSGYSGIIGGPFNIYTGPYNHCFSSVISSYRSCIITNTAPGYGSVIVGSRTSCLTNPINSSIVSSYGAYVNNDNNTNSSVISSGQSYTRNSMDSVIISNIASRVYDSCSSVIISTQNSCICDSKNSAIVGGYYNCVFSSSESVILGGRNNCLIGVTNSVILGGSYITASNVFNTTLSQKMLLTQKVIFKPLSSNPSPLEDGMIWYRNNQLYIRLNGVTGTFSLVL